MGEGVYENTVVVVEFVKSRKAVAGAGRRGSGVYLAAH